MQRNSEHHLQQHKKVPSRVDEKESTQNLQLQQIHPKLPHGAFQQIEKTTELIEQLQRDTKPLYKDDCVLLPPQLDSSDIPNCKAEETWEKKPRPSSSRHVLDQFGEEKV